MNRLSLARREQVLRCLEGNSLRSTTRLTGVALATVTGVLRSVGYACQKYQNETLRNLPCKHLQLDEIWAFVGCKAKNADTVKPRTRELSE